MKSERRFFSKGPGRVFARSLKGAPRALRVLVLLAFLASLASCYVRSCDSSKNWEYLPAEKETHAFSEILSEEKWKAFYPLSRVETTTTPSDPTALRYNYPGAKFTFSYPGTAAYELPDIRGESPQAELEAVQRYLDELYLRLNAVEVLPLAYPAGTKDHSAYVEGLRAEKENMCWLELDDFKVHDAWAYLSSGAIPGLDEPRLEGEAGLDSLRFNLFSPGECWLTLSYLTGGREKTYGRYVYVIEDKAFNEALLRDALDWAIRGLASRGRP